MKGLGRSAQRRPALDAQAARLHVDLGRNGWEVHRNQPGKLQIGMKGKAEGGMVKAQLGSEIGDARLILVLYARGFVQL
jgi:hypothetical protein